MIKAWTEPDAWQQPRPAVAVLDGSAYVTEPATNTVHAVDVATGKVWNSHRLETTPNELTGVTGEVEHAGHGDERHQADAGTDSDDHQHGDGEQSGSSSR